MKYPTTTYIHWVQTSAGWLPRKEAKRRGLVLTKKDKARFRRRMKRKRASA